MQGVTRKNSSGSSSPSGMDLARRKILFSLGDCLFLVSVGVVTTESMHLMHQWVTSFWIACLLGMTAGMVVQMLMAYGMSPLLGSIEAMVPSMVLAMLAPMFICIAHMMGYRSTCESAAMWGVGTGLLMYAFVVWYETCCVRRLRRAHVGDAGT